MSIKLFKKEKLKVRESDGGGEETLDISFTYPPLFSSANGMMVALAEVEKVGGTYDILTKYIETQGDNWGDRAMEDSGKNWKAQLVLNNGRQCIVFALVARGDSVYVLSAITAQSAPPLSSQQTTNTKKWDFKLTVGTITDSGNAAEKNIVWNTKDVPDSSAMSIQEYLEDVYPNSGSAFLTEDGTFVFVLSGHCAYRKKNVYVFAHSKDPNSDLTFYASDPDEYLGCFFLWGKQLFRVAKHYRLRGDIKLRVSNDMGKTWGEASGPLMEKLYSLQGEKFAFTPITIEGRRVLLFAEIPCTDDSSREEEINVYEDFLEEHCINVFIADVQHIEKVGRIFVIIKENSGGKFLYTNDELFFLYHGRGRARNVLFFRLKGHLGRIKLLLEKWYPGDEEQTTGPAAHVADMSENLTELAGTKTSGKRRR